MCSFLLPWAVAFRALSRWVRLLWNAWSVTVSAERGEQEPAQAHAMLSPGAVLGTAGTSVFQSTFFLHLGD